MNQWNQSESDEKYIFAKESNHDWVFVNFQKNQNAEKKKEVR